MPDIWSKHKYIKRQHETKSENRKISFGGLDTLAMAFNNNVFKKRHGNTEDFSKGWESKLY